MQELSSEDFCFEGEGLHLALRLTSSTLNLKPESRDPSQVASGMVQEWNAIQMFIRTLRDGCSYFSTLQVGMVPAIRKAQRAKERPSLLFDVMGVSIASCGRASALA
ncbi:unnamed protein product [Symbiodinium natans]|uniref:Uncharacterized protein n=1 Tax=Symbiodinium natans TaxID=878477 RepID=A0A812KK02_9DINO|nr:unnamed protein product [Symbiodinium natans]